MRLSQVLKVAVEVSRGMDYLHQRKIVHRDLKAANLLMDDHGIVKVGVGCAPKQQQVQQCVSWCGFASSKRLLSAAFCLMNCAKSMILL